MKTRIYHNPRCSKSRATLGLLEERGIEPEVVEYLKSPPDEKRLRELLRKLDMPAIDLVRKSENAWRESGLDAGASEGELIALMVRHPILIERPIVEVGSRARIGRPPERVLELFE
jgi:arsenate reductase (glutaredoxin)